MARRRGTKIATTAIARKLLTRARHLLTDAEHTTVRHNPPPAPAPPTGRRHRPGGGRQTPGELAIIHEPAMPRSKN